MTNGIRPLSLLLGFARVAILLALVLMIPAVAEGSTKKPPPPPPSSWATAYSVPYSYSVAESISQASSVGTSEYEPSRHRIHLENCAVSQMIEPPA